jgi:hypothetical protein
MDNYLKFGFLECSKNNCRLLGLYPACNYFFMADSWSTDLKFCIGCSYGVIKLGLEPYRIDDEDMGLKEDYYRTCAYYKADGIVIRLNFISPKTKFSKNKGGLELLRTKANYQISADDLKKRYPDWVTIYTRDSTGIAEIRLSDKITYKRPHLINQALKNIIYMEPQDPMIFKTMIDYLIKDPPKNTDHRKNTGYGRTQPYGIINRLWGLGTGLVSNNDKFPHIWNEARNIAKIIVPASINYTTVMINMNYQALPHTDKNNVGPSLVVAMGDYTGGDLITIDVSGNETAYNIRYRPVIMDASIITHYVKPITSGTRYSIIFFRGKMTNAILKKYGNDISLDELLELLPAKKEGQTNADVRIPV